MKTIGTWLAGIILSAIIIGVCKLGHRYDLCNCGDYPKDSTNETHVGRSNVMVQYMLNPVYKWHPLNVNHVNHHR